MTEPEKTATEGAAASASEPEKNPPHEEPTLDPSHPDHPEHPEKKHLHKRWFFFGTCAILFIIAFCIANADHFSAVFAKIGTILTPLIIGCVIAYLCNPFLNFYEYIAFRRIRHTSLRRGLSLLCTMLTAFGIIAVIIALIVPELVNSIETLITGYKGYLDKLLTFVQGIINRITENWDVDIDISDVDKLKEFITKMFGSVQDALNKVLGVLQNFVLDENFLNDVWVFLKGVVDVFKNLLLGIFIGFYLLSSREKRVAQLRKFRAAFFSEKQDSRLGEIVALVDRTFGAYIKGMLLDALAVGVVTFIFLTIFQISDYNLLIAAICGVTNIIPVFGPFIGAIPSALIVLISNPDNLLPFIIIILVIQQIDGNILVPKIQGNNTGISSLAVLVAITVMGSMFGIIGMVIGVPIFAVIIELVKQLVERRLVARDVPTDTTYYYASNAVANAEEEVYYEHAHLLYLYEHSKLKVYVDRTLAAFRRLFVRIETWFANRFSRKKPSGRSKGSNAAKKDAKKKSKNQKK